MKLKTFILLLTSTLLTSCVVAVVAGAASSLVVYDKRTLNMVEKDARIFHTIHTAITPDARFRESRIVVSSFNEVVLLVGETPTASLRTRAEQIAKQTPNVRRVYNEITIDYPLSLSQKSQDTLITGQVRTHMLTQKGLESGSLRVITENGNVYLMGIVAPEQADLAVNTARQVNGVRKVVKTFQYIR
jgi:osmotically-inducible protein OsmY